MIFRSHPFQSAFPYLAPLLLLSASASNVVNNKSSLDKDDKHPSLFTLSTNVSYPATISQPLQQSSVTTVPAVPVERHPSSCQIELSDELFSGLREACSGTEISRRGCCPILASWLFAARAKFALQTPVSVIPGMPELPDDSTVCVANLEAALEARGIHLTTPNASCDAIICFCGLQPNKISAANCQSMFYDHSDVYHYPSSIDFQGWDMAPAEPPTQFNDDSSQLPISVRALQTNCADHSYTGCTKCLNTLQMVTRHTHKLQSALSKAENLDCQVMGLVWLLATNQTLYVPTVSTVLRAIMYSDYPRKPARCSHDHWASLPLAVQSSEIPRSAAHPFLLPSRAPGFLAMAAALSIVSLLLSRLLHESDHASYLDYEDP